MNKTTENHIIIYTDGACSGNPGKGGWGAVLMANQHRKEISGGMTQTTNNQMELTAVIEALKIIKKPSAVQIFTDSKYVMDGITKWINGWKYNGWKTKDKKPVKNIELWQALDFEVSRHHIQWHWVKGHSGNENNEIADQLARQAISKI